MLILMKMKMSLVLTKIISESCDPLLQFSTEAEKVLKKIENESNMQLKLIGGKGES